jgi:hypothetical protein
MKSGDICELKHKDGNMIRIVIVNINDSIGPSIVSARKIAKKTVNDPNWISEIGTVGVWRTLNDENLIECKVLLPDEIY